MTSRPSKSAPAKTARRPASESGKTGAGPAKPPRPVQVANRYRRLKVDRKQVRRLIDVLDSLPTFPIPEGELSLAFLDDPQITEVHAQFLEDPTPTDVITFPGDPEAGFAGEICVSADHAQFEAEKRGHAFARELTLYLVHGWLHLAGYDDHEPADRRAMRAAERRVMAALEAANAFPAFALAEKPATHRS